MSSRHDLQDSSGSALRYVNDGDVINDVNERASHLMKRRIKGIKHSSINDELSRVITTYYTESEDDSVFVIDYHHAVWSSVNHGTSCISIDKLSRGKWKINMMHYMM